MCEREEILEQGLVNAVSLQGPRPCEEEEILDNKPRSHTRRGEQNEALIAGRLLKRGNLTMTFV